MERKAAHDAEVSELKQSLERAEEKLGRMKKQLEEKQGMFEHLLRWAQINKCAY